MPGEETGETKLSKYNQALGQLMRMDYLWQKFHSLVLRGDTNQADFVLDRVWGELSGDIKEGDETEFKKINKDLAELKNEKGFIKDKEKFYENIMEKETFLRKLQNKQGKGTAYEEDDDFE